MHFINTENVEPILTFHHLGLWLILKTLSQYPPLIVENLDHCLYRENAIAIESEASDSLTYYRRIDQRGFWVSHSILHSMSSVVGNQIVAVPTGRWRSTMNVATSPFRRFIQLDTRACGHRSN